MNNACKLRIPEWLQFYGDLETKGVAEVFKEAERLQVSVLFLPVPAGEPVQAVQNRAVNFFEVPNP